MSCQVVKSNVANLRVVFCGLRKVSTALRKVNFLVPQEKGILLYYL